MAAGLIILFGMIGAVILTTIIFYEPKDKPYILNKNTFEIHNKSCPCLEFMERSNMKYITKEKRDKLIAEDPHSVCERCKSK